MRVTPTTYSDVRIKTMAIRGKCYACISISIEKINLIESGLDVVDYDAKG